MATGADLTFRISAELGEVRAALASLRQQIAGITQGASGFDAVNDQLRETPRAARDAEQAVKRTATEQERAARQAARAQQRVAAEAAQAQRNAEREATISARRQAAEKERIARESARRQERIEAEATRKAETARQAAVKKAERDAIEASRAQAKAAAAETRKITQAAPQVTDIVVSLASGQSPFLVALQQGGQLRDLFGGLLPAVRAVGGAIAAMISPITLLIGGVAGLAVAYAKGQDEALRFERSLIETGNTAGVTGGQLVEMARDLDATFGITVASASETLNQVVQAGKFTAEQVRAVATAAEAARNSSGKAASATIAEFAKIADDPVRGVQELNRQYNFLTGSTFAQIRALQQQGRTQEAATLAMRTFADVTKERAPEILANLGYIERGWEAIKKTAREAGSAVLNIGRQQSGQEQFDELFKRRQELQQRLSQQGGLFGGRRRETDQRELADVNRQLQELVDARVSAEQKAARDAAQQRAVSLQGELATEAQQYETNAQRRVRTRQAIENRAAAALADAQIAGDKAAQAEIIKARDELLAGLGRETGKSASAIASIDAGLVRDATDRALTELDRLYDRGEVKLAEFLSRKAQLQTQAVDAELRAARADLATAAEPEERRRAEAEIIKLQRQRAQIGKDIEVERSKLARETSDQVIDIKARQLEEEGRLEEAAALRFEREYRQLRRRLAAEGDADSLSRIDQIFAAEQLRLRQQTADQVTQLKAQQLENEGRLEDAAVLRLETQYRDMRKRLATSPEAAELIDKLIDTEKARARFNELRTQFDQAAATMQSRLAAISQGVATGQITPEQGRADEATARAEAIAQITELNAKLQELAQRVNDPTIKQGAAEAAAALQQLGREGATGLAGAMENLRTAYADLQKNFAGSAVNAGVDAINGLFTDLASGSKSSSEAIKDFARSFVASMAQVAARALATYIVLQALSAITGIPVQVLGAASSVGANVKHGGGMAGHGTRRNVSPLAFVGAPRFHSGSGVLGLKAGEIPAILQEGERVQSRQEVAASKQDGGTGGGTRIVNVIDPALVQDYMTSASGERTILNVIERNAGSVRQKLA
jgi:phage-related minor tail protein